MCVSDDPAARVPERRLYVVATVHLDTQWRWTIRDTIRDFLPATLSRNFELLRRHPFFVVSFEGAFRYMLIKEYYPRRFDELKAWIAAGRWRPAGSMLDAPDVNLAAPESLLRHILYGNGFFQREFGDRSLDVFLPDCFGFGFALPSIAAHCGLIGFSSQKFGRWMAPAAIPFDLGVWQGPDGAEVLAALRPEGYGEGLGEDLSRAERYVRRLDATGEDCGARVGLKYVGVGDRGGGLDDASMEWLARSVAGTGPLRVVVGGSDQLFRELEPAQVRKLPRHRGELLLPTHGTGCWSSQAELKRRNRRLEQLADAAERAAAIADWLRSLPYPGDRLREAWTRFLWHQMHDDLTGTSIPDAYRFSRRDQLLSLHEFAAILTQSIAAVAADLDTRCRGQAIVVFNPLSSERQDLVEVRLTPEAVAHGVRVLDFEGREVLSQVLARPPDDARVVFLARVPPLGVRVFDLRSGASTRQAAADLEIGDSWLENHRYKVEIGGKGDVVQVMDKATGRELLAGPLELQLLPDRSRRWPAWEIRFADVQAEPLSRVTGPARIRILERGPARIALQIERRARRSRFRQILRLAAEDAGERFEVLNEIDWRARGRLLKASFPLAASTPSAIYDLGLGVIERGINRRQQYEVPAQQWAAQLAAYGEGGTSILNDCKYGWDKPDDRTLRLTLLRSPSVLRRFRHQGRQDHGHHRFTYALYGHADDWQAADSSWQAARLNQPLLAFHSACHDGALGRSFSFLHLSSSQIALKTLKKTEAGDRLVLRLQELSGRPCATLQIRCAGRITGAQEVNGVEEVIADCPLQAGRLLLDTGRFALRSLSLELDAPHLPPSTITSRPLRLPYDVVATRPQGRADRRGFDGRGYSFPAEQFPAQVEVGGVEFSLGPASGDVANAVACRGQQLELGAHAAQALHLLAASTAGHRVAIFQCRDRELGITVYPYTGLFETGRFGGRTHGPGSRERTSLAGVAAAPEVAWVGGHRHGPDGGDRPYDFCYLFRYRLDLPPGGKSITLPNDPYVRLFAATLANDRLGDTSAAHPLYD